jgi:hypothetical protein
MAKLYDFPPFEEAGEYESAGKLESTLARQSGDGGVFDGRNVRVTGTRTRV